MKNYAEALFVYSCSEPQNLMVKPRSVEIFSACNNGHHSRARVCVSSLVCIAAYIHCGATLAYRLYHGQTEAAPDQKWRKHGIAA